MKFRTKLFHSEIVPFYLFKFHNYFDGILGYETLSKIKAKLDFDKCKLIIKNKAIDMKIRMLGEPEEITVNAHSITTIKMPVSQANGSILLPNDKRIHTAIIRSGIYNSTNGYAQVTIENPGEEFSFHWTKPTLTHSMSDYIEYNQTSCTTDSNYSTHDIEQLIRINHLNDQEKTKLLSVLKKYSNVIQKTDEKLSCTTNIKHTINTKDDIPIHTKTYRYPQIHKAEVDKQIEQMLTDGIIQHSISPWTSPIWIVPKKVDASGTRKWRVVIDYRKLNEKTIDDKFPIPNIDEILDRLGRSMYFTTLDLKSGFHQIEVEEKDRPKTAFSTNKGHFEFIRMPFGLKNAPATFQRAMNSILNELIGRCCLVYLDDIIIFGSSLQQHLDNLDKVLKKLTKANLKIQLDKCEFLQRECEFLGHIVTENGIKPNPNKIDKIINWPIPKTAKQIKGFLGILGYYRKFIKDFAKLTKPLTRCLKKDAKIIHDNEFITCFEECKTLLTTDPILKYPDFEKKFILETDASDFALGAVLSQKFEDGKEHPICYASRTLNETECRYSATEKELLAIIWSTKHFRPYLYGRKFDIRTDHKPLVWLRQKNDLNRKLLNWKLTLEEFEFDITYKKGILNNNADALSRMPDNQPQLTTNTLTPSETLEINNNSIDDDMTQHSADTDDNDFIKSTLKPLNEFRHQLVLIKSQEHSRQFETIFPNYHRTTIKRLVFSPGVLINILKEETSPNHANGLYCSKEILQTLQIIYKNYFSRAKSLKIFWTEKILIDIPEDDEQDQIIQTRHDSNHRGIVETQKHISQKYFFPKMKSKITKVINLCRLCQKSKYERHPYKPKFLDTGTPSKPLEIVHMDIFIIKEKHYLTFCDRFSRLATSLPIRTRNTIHVINALTHYLANVGKPSLLIMDQEASFTSSMVKEFLEDRDIEYHYTSVGQSTSNGTVEIVHRTLRELHNILSNKESTKNLSETAKMNLSVAIYNDSIHSQTKLTPREAFFGYRNESPIPECLDERIRQKEEFYKQLYERQKEKKIKDTEKLNKGREEPEQFLPGNVAFERKRNNLKHQERYREIIIAENRQANIIDENGRKIHKTKLKRKRNLPT
uniref:Polyprotein n=1 Tax=Breu errantivirus TaxID=3078398 RepID=A0AB38Z266_9VIRU